uniref:Protein MIS12 homolog n=1 Tax=Clastoptera arizonana TaxID=38151 RepID=A0A1B6BXT1_9HEMI
MDFRGKTDINNEEYEAQFFNFTSSDVAETVKQILEDEVMTSFNKMKDCILTHCTCKEDVDQLNLTMSALTNEYRKIITAKCVKLKENVHKIIKIPEHILLPEDACQKEQYTIEEELNLDKEIADLQRKFKNASCMQLLLKKELEQNDLSEVASKVIEMRKIDQDIQEEENVNKMFSKLAKKNIQKLQLVTTRLKNIQISPY